MDRVDNPTCTVGLVAFDSSPSSHYPAFVCRYRSDLGADVLTDVELVFLEADPFGDGVARIILNTIGHIHCECAAETKEYFCEVSAGTVVKFFNRLADTKCFVWMISTPSFEIRALVEQRSQRIIKRETTDRVLQ